MIQYDRAVSFAKPVLKMKFTVKNLASASRLKCVGIFGLFVVVGCKTPPMPANDTDQHIQSAASLATAIKFHTNALPVEATAGPNRLPLSGAIEQSLRQSPEIQIALAKVRTAQSAAKQSRLFPNPILNVVLRQPEGGRSTIIEAGLAAKLTELLQRPRRISAADAQLRAASANAVTTTLDVIHDTQQNYFKIVALRKEVAILTARSASLSKLLRVTEVRLAAGEGTQLDVTTLRAELATANLDLREANRKIKAAKYALAHRLGQPAGRIDWELVTPLYTQIALSIEGDAIKHGLLVRPEIQTDRWQLAALEDATALAKLTWLEGAAAGLNTERDANWSLGPAVTLPLPIFDNGQARREGARAQAIASRQRLTQTTRQVTVEIREAHHAVAELMTTTSHVRTRLLPLHEQRVTLARKVFEAGQEDVTRLRLAELDHLEAQLKHIQLQHQTTSAILRLDRATGGSTLEIENENN